MDDGGNPIIVQIDESKFGKRKYNRGHRVEGVWVVGGVEITNKRRCFLVTVPNRNAETMKTIIQKFIRPGTTIYSDCWRAYDNIPEWGDFSHETVNHSEEFVTRNGVHTQVIEGIFIYNVKMIGIINIPQNIRYLEWC